MLREDLFKFKKMNMRSLGMIFLGSMMLLDENGISYYTSWEKHNSTSIYGWQQA